MHGERQRGCAAVCEGPVAVCLPQPVEGDHYYHVHVLTEGAMHHGDLSFLQPLSHFKAFPHPLYPNAANLFRMSTQTSSILTR